MNSSQEPSPLELLAISSSPRRRGNSELLLEAFNRGLQKEGWNVTTIRLCDLKFSPCRACEQCATTGNCVVPDDLQKIYPLVVSAGAIVLATPVYFGTLSAQLKMFIDRFQCWWHAKYTLNEPRVKLEENRPGFLICAGALKNKAYFENALAVTKVFFHCINYHYAGSLFYPGLDKKGAVQEHPEMLQNAYEEGRRFAIIPGQ